MFLILNCCVFVHNQEINCFSSRGCKSTCTRFCQRNLVKESACWYFNYSRPVFHRLLWCRCIKVINHSFQCCRNKQVASLCFSLRILNCSLACANCRNTCFSISNRSCSNIVSWCISSILRKSPCIQFRHYLCT